MGAEVQDKLEEVRRTLSEKHRAEIESLDERQRQDKISWENLMQERLDAQLRRKEVRAMHVLALLAPSLFGTPPCVNPALCRHARALARRKRCDSSLKRSGIWSWSG